MDKKPMNTSNASLTASNGKRPPSRHRSRILGALIALLLLGGGVALAQGGPFTAQSENFWRLISTGGRTFQTLRVTTLINTGGSTAIDTLCLSSTSQDACLARMASGTILFKNGPSGTGWTGLIFGTADVNGAQLLRNGAGFDIVSGNNGVFTGLRANTYTVATQNATGVTFGTDNSADIGASGANRPRTGYFGIGIAAGPNAVTTGAAVDIRTDTLNNLTWGGSTAVLGTLSYSGTNSRINAATGQQLCLGANGANCDFTIDATNRIGVKGVPSIVFVAADFTVAANTNLQTITGLTWALPANTAINIPIRCVLFYSQATAAVADSFGLQTSAVTPTNFQAGGAMETALGTTATAVVTGTPSATATVFNAYVDALLENPSNASITNLNVMVKTSAAADLVTVKRGSFCRAF
jgi:hypothetical protein